MNAKELLTSAYEAARLENIKRNQQELEKLGFLGRDFGKPEGTKRLLPDEKLKQPKKKKIKQTPTRRSSRLRNEAPDNLPESMKRPTATKPSQLDEDTLKKCIMERKIAILRRLHQENETGYKNSTTTYEHTWKRVRTMSDKALFRRVNVIEKAKGQHCIVKMRMFAEVLILAGKTELAEAAQNALDRLLTLVSKTKLDGEQSSDVKVTTAEDLNE